MNSTMFAILPLLTIWPPANFRPFFSISSLVGFAGGCVNLYLDEMAAIIVVPSAPPSGRNSSMGKSHVVLPLSRETTFITTLLSGDRAGHKLGLPPTRFPSAD